MKNNEYIYVSFALHKKRDYRLINWLSEQSNKTDTIRKALTEIMQNNQNELSEILEIVRDLQSKQFSVTPNGSNPQVIKQVEETESSDIAGFLNDFGK